MNTVQTQINRLTANPIGAIGGAGAGYYVATKLIKTEKQWMTWAVVIVGGIVGASIQSKMAAKSGVPSASTVTGKK